MTKPPQDWDPAAADVLGDQVAAYDEMRRRCPVAHSEFLEWSLFRHEDVAGVIADAETFSNAVSTHRSVPNGMDPPEHTAYRQAIEPYLGTESVQNFEPECRGLAKDLLAPISSGVEIDFMDAFAVPSIQNLTNTKWRQAQFATTSRLASEASASDCPSGTRPIEEGGSFAGCEDVNFTPGWPFHIMATGTVFF